MCNFRQLISFWGHPIHGSTGLFQRNFYHTADRGEFYEVAHNVVDQLL